MYLVTGGAGFLGSHIVAELAERGLGGETVIVDDVGEKWRNLGKRAPRSIFPISSLEQIIDTIQFDAIFHMGALSSTAETDGTKLVEVNASLTEALFARCREPRTKFIYASSASVYGKSGKQQVANNDIESLKALRPTNAYGWSKKLADCMIADASAKLGRERPPWAGLRFFNVFGPNEAHKGDQASFITRCFKAIRSNQLVRVWEGSDGFARDWVRAEDCARIAVEIGLSDEDHHGIINVGTGVATSFWEVAVMCMLIAGVTGAPKIVPFPEERRADYQSFTCSPDKHPWAADWPIGRAIRDYWDRYASQDGLDRFR